MKNTSRPTVPCGSFATKKDAASTAKMHTTDDQKWVACKAPDGSPRPFAMALKDG